MENKTYITTQEREKCRRVADAFAELKREDVDIIVADIGRYGFVILSYYDEAYGFGRANCYTDSAALFNDLWQAWLNEQLFQIAVEIPSLMNLNYKDIFQALPAEKQQELTDKRHDFAQKSGIMND